MMDSQPRVSRQSHVRTTMVQFCVLLLSHLFIPSPVHSFSPQPVIVSPTPQSQRLSSSPPSKSFFALSATSDRRKSSHHLSTPTTKRSSDDSSTLIKASLDLDAGGAKDSVSSPLDHFSWGSLQTNELILTKLGNAVLLAACFGFAAYTILTIDNGMTRGWTSGEIAIRLPIDNWLNYENSLADRPIVTKTAINVIIYLLGDWLSQTVFCGKNVLEFDAARTLRNGLIGLFFGPLVHEYYQFSDAILPVEGGMWNRLEKICMDQTVYLTVKCSIYIAAVGFLNGDSAKAVKTNVQTKLPGIVVTAWKFWPLVHMVTYGVIPARHRILWVNCVDLIWNAILASMSQAEEEVIDEAAAVDVTDSMVLETVVGESSPITDITDAVSPSSRSLTIDTQQQPDEALQLVAASSTTAVLEKARNATDTISSTADDVSSQLQQ